MNAATEKVYQDLISECMCMQIVFEGGKEYELAARYLEKEKELIEEYEYLKTPEGWEHFTKYQEMKAAKHE